MSNNNLSETSSTHSPPEGRVRGARRQKVIGYLKAANDLRQSYQAQALHRVNGNDDEQGIPGAFPDVEIVRSGDEEMILFPSYARKHIKKHPATLPGAPRDFPSLQDDTENPESGDAEYWKREWEKYEDDNAVVDVDVRGWIYSPHREPISRRNRLLVAVARKLSGIPALETSPTGSSRQPNEHLSQLDRIEERTARHEDEAATKAARSIVQKGEIEVKIAWRGGYSEDPSRGYDTDSPKTNNSRSVSPMGSLESTRLRHSLTESEITSGDEDPGASSIEKRRSWNQPATMTKEELAKANHHLMARLKPFMTIPLAHTAITIFFFNENKSQSRSIHTDESGHFNVRASLDFVPTTIRVLASENLSATEKVIITEEKGISLVSDIDDTIKHSAIASGAREIFKNTFIRELGDLTIPGVKEWYNKMAELDVKLHFVSNSPWQLYPVLRCYFSLAGLPSGSFHLKQYSGMLQGIFEPAAERKRGSLEKIMHDFPERKFILVGDSGEADLEVYSDVVAENPGRVLAVFIRDVTTPEKKKSFDQAVANTPPDSRGNSVQNSKPFIASDSPEDRPPLPRRSNTAQVQDLPEADLIDFDEPLPARKEENQSHTADLLELQHSESNVLRSPPARPSKPSSLRGLSIDPQAPISQDRIASSENIAPEDTSSTPEPPPKPARPSAMVHLPSTAAHTQGHLPHRSPVASDQQHNSRPNLHSHTSSSSTIRSLRPHLHSHKSSNSKSPTQAHPPPPDFYVPDYHVADDQNESFAAAARRQLNTAYNALPSIRSVSLVPEADNLSSNPPIHLPRRALTSYTTPTTRWATSATGVDPAGGGDGDAHPGATYNKKEEVWKRRWARAEELMRSHDVLLRSWREGGDVIDECVRLVQLGKEELERESGRRGGVSLTGSTAPRGPEGS
jgi:phosphatidate phosphatase APP1